MASVINLQLQAFYSITLEYDKIQYIILSLNNECRRNYSLICVYPINITLIGIRSAKPPKPKTNVCRRSAFSWLAPTQNISGIGTLHKSEQVSSNLENLWEPGFSRLFHITIETTLNVC